MNNNFDKTIWGGRETRKDEADLKIRYNNRTFRLGAITL
jgi:hypothetical protein